jgi:hypothetical protein
MIEFNVIDFSADYWDFEGTRNLSEILSRVRESTLFPVKALNYKI